MGKHTLWSFALQISFLLSTSCNLVAGQSKEEKLNIVDLSFETKRPSTDLIILHQTETNTVEEALSKMKESRNTTHYIVAKNGTIFRLVKEEYRAWHMGTGGWYNISNMDMRSIGIHMVNKRLEEYPQSQLKAVFGLVSNLRQRYNIRLLNIVGARDVDLTKHYDPSYLFPWKDLYAHMGVFEGLYKSNLTKEEQKQMLVKGYFDEDQDVYNKLRRIGYGNENTELHGYNMEPAFMIFAFNAHFCPEVIDPRGFNGNLDAYGSNFNWYKLSNERAIYLLEHDT